MAKKTTQPEADHPRDDKKRFAAKAPAGRYCIGGPKEGEIAETQPVGYSPGHVVLDGVPDNSKDLWVVDGLDVNAMYSRAVLVWEKIP